jgi:hypothetical protein
MIAMLLSRLGLVRADPAPPRAVCAREAHLVVVMDNFC